MLVERSLSCTPCSAGSPGRLFPGLSVHLVNTPHMLCSNPIRSHNSEVGDILPVPEFGRARGGKGWLMGADERPELMCPRLLD